MKLYIYIWSYFHNLKSIHDKIIKLLLVMITFSVPILYCAGITFLVFLNIIDLFIASLIFILSFPTNAEFCPDHLGEYFRPEHFLFLDVQMHSLANNLI